MGSAWLLIPAPNWPLLNRLADRYERTGEGEVQFTLVFEHMGLNTEVLVDYAVLLADRQRQS